MSIKYFANRVKESSITTGSGNFVLSGPFSGYKDVLSTIGANNKFTYYIYRQDTNFEWEIGVGYIFDSGGVIVLVRESVVSSSNINTFVNFTSGTKIVETIISEDRINTNLLNLEEKSANFVAPYMPATYVVDASVSNITATLPEVDGQTESVIINFLLNKTIGDQYSQPGAINIVPNGSETISGSSSYNISIKSDYLSILALPAQTGWVLLDPIQDSTNAFGIDGSIQVKYDSAFSGVNSFNWDFNNSSLLIGGTGTITTADIIMPGSSGTTVVFNEQSYDNDFRVEGTGNTHLFFIDGSENKIAINSTNAKDCLFIDAQYGNGLTVGRSGVGPKIFLENTAASGNMTDGIVGQILFSGLNNAGNPKTYSKIYSFVDSVVDGQEYSEIYFEVMNNGAMEPAAIFSYSGVTLGFNNSNINGIIVGDVSQNEGNNVVLGYYHDICGESCVAIGHSGVISSGTFGGIIGKDHVASGNNVWVIGGSGVNITTNDTTLLALNNNNHLSVLNSGTLDYTSYTSGNNNFNIENTYVLSSGIDQQINFVFSNSTAVKTTGLSIGSRILDPTNSTENTEFFAQLISNGIKINTLNISGQSINVGSNTLDGNNHVFGTDNAVSGDNNNIFGSGINSSGNNNVLIGKNISHSGNNTIILGKDIVCETSGNVGISIFGSNNTANEDYVSIFGNSNISSGLYSVSMGYSNGVHGEYSVGIGENNLIINDASVAIGNNNMSSGLSIDSTSFMFGIGNTVQVYNTGLALGYNNNLSGSGALVFGGDITSSGLNNIIIGINTSVSGDNNIVIGNNRNIYNTGVIDIFADASNGLSITSTGLFLNSSQDFSLNNNLIVNGTGIFIDNLISSGNFTCSQTGNFGFLKTLTNGVNLTVTNDDFVVGADTYPSGTLRINAGGDFYIYQSGDVPVINIDRDGLYASGDFTYFSTDTLNLPSMSSPTGIDSVKGLSYQDNEVKYNDLAFSGSLTGTRQLTSSDAEYQFLYSSSSYDVVLPNGTGLYMGKKFVIANMDGLATITVKNIDTTTLASLNGTVNVTFVHAGDNKWIKTSYNSFGFYVDN